MKDEDIIEKVMEENREGLERLAREEPAAEKRSKVKRFKRKILSFFRDEEKVGRITA